VSSEIISIEEAFELKSLESRAVNASFWTIIEYGSSMALRIANSLILTRLLLPRYFGEITLVSTLIVGISLLSDIGLAPSVIQSSRGDDPLFLNTAWTIQVMRGIGLWAVALAISWPVAIFYHDPKLRFVLPVLAFYTVLNGFNSTNLLTLSRHLGVRRLFAIDFSTQVIALIVTVTWAYFWPSVWAIVGGNMASNLYRLCIGHSRLIAPGIRNRFLWDKDSVHSIVHFGKWIFLGTAFFFFASQADRLILGRLLTLSMLGIYGIAYALSDIPRSILLALSSKVGYPFVSKMIHLPMSVFRPKFLQYRLYALIIGALALTPMVIWGNELIFHLYDHRYHEAAWMIPILAIGLWHTMLYSTTSMVLFSLGKTKYNAVGNAAYGIAMVTGIPIAFHFFGLPGAVVAVAAGDFPLYVVTQFGATREGVRPLRQDLLMTGFFLASLSLCFFLRRVL
jgi:O-antigen/teichoic acid export membrane protein